MDSEPLLSYEDVRAHARAFQREMKRGVAILLAELGWTNRKAARAARINESTFSTAMSENGTLTADNFAAICGAARRDRAVVLRKGRDSIADELDQQIRDASDAQVLEEALLRLPPDQRLRLVERIRELEPNGGGRGEEVA